MYYVDGTPSQLGVVTILELTAGLHDLVLHLYYAHDLLSLFGDCISMEKRINMKTVYKDHSRDLHNMWSLYTGGFYIQVVLRG